MCARRLHLEHEIREGPGGACARQQDTCEHACACTGEEAAILTLTRYYDGKESPIHRGKSPTLTLTLTLILALALALALALTLTRSHLQPLYDVFAAYAAPPIQVRA